MKNYIKNYIKNYMKKKREAEEAQKKAAFMRRLKMSPEERKEFDMAGAIGRATGAKP